MRDLNSFEELDEAMSALHDCPFDMDRADFNATTQTWTGTFLRPLYDDPKAGHVGWGFVYSRSNLPVAQAIVTFTNVASASVVDDQKIGRYGFNQIERTRDGVRLRFNEVMRIELRVVGPVHATYEERASPELRAVYRQLLLLQSGPKIE